MCSRGSGNNKQENLDTDEEVISFKNNLVVQEKDLIG